MVGGHGHRHADMLSVEDAFERVMAYFHPLEAEEKPLLQALGQVLAEDVASPVQIPPMDNSAMDGYAVRHEAISGASEGSPRLLRVTGQVATGQVPRGRVSGDGAIRIMTGAPVPEGADTVVPFEDTDEVERKSKAPACRRAHSKQLRVPWRLVSIALVVAWTEGSAAASMSRSKVPVSDSKSRGKRTSPWMNSMLRALKSAKFSSDPRRLRLSKATMRRLG